jgi:hypothetical protein
MKRGLQVPSALHSARAANAHIACTFTKSGPAATSAAHRVAEDVLSE